MSTSRRASGVSCGSGIELQPHAGMALDEIAQRPGEVIGREAVRRADPHVAGEFEVDVGNLALGVQEGALHLLGGAQKRSPALVSLRAGGAPVEQLRAERGLQRRDAAADGRVVEPQPLGRGDELSGARDGEKDPDVVPVHGSRCLAHFSHSRCAISAIAVRKSLAHKSGTDKPS